VSATVGANLTREVDLDRLLMQCGGQINYFKLLATMGQKGVPMNPEANRKAMAVSLLFLSPVDARAKVWGVVVCVWRMCGM
jgi:hypothetical protein